MQRCNLFNTIAKICNGVQTCEHSKKNKKHVSMVLAWSHWRYPEYQRSSKLVQDSLPRKNSMYFYCRAHTTYTQCVSKGPGDCAREVLELVVHEHANAHDEVLRALDHRLLHRIRVRNWCIVHANAVDRGVKEIEALLVNN